MTVLSSLGQPLRAEIELTSVSKDEADSLAVKLASPEAYRQANVEFHPILFSLRFAVENRGNRHIVKVTSAQAVNEPFVGMLLELEGANNRLTREYTVLLDPADLRLGSPTQLASAPVASPRNAAQATVAQSSSLPPSSEKPAAKQSRPASATAARPADSVDAPAREASESDRYRVERGDTLTAIANQMRPEGVSLDQMLVALYRANTKAFIGNNMNRLRAGQILSMPDAEAAKNISASEARGIIVAQAADFNAYRNKLADQVATDPTAKTADTTQSAAGKITAQVEEKATPANDAKDKLKLSKAGAAPKGAAEPSGNLTGSTEDVIAKEKALAEDKARVKELERNISDLQKVLEVKSKDMAEQQKQADPAQPANAPVPAVGATAQAAPAPADGAAPGAAEPADGQEAGDQAASTAVKDQSPVVEAEKTAPVEAKPQAAPVQPALVEPSFLDDLLDNSMLLSSVAGLLAALGALGLYNLRRKKKAQQYEDSLLADSSLKANSLFGSTGGQSVDTNNSVFNSSFSPATSQLDANEVDPVAEADVYIAYGRDAQAEEILKEALHTQPERHAIRVKLLEIYANRKDLRAFETLASELYSLTRGQGEDWSQAVSMGAALDPGNPLFAGDKAAGKASAKNVPLAAAPSAAQDKLEDLQKAEAEPDPLEDGFQINSAYFDNTAQDDRPAELAQKANSAKPEAKSSTVSPLDFDLDGLDIQAPQIPQDKEEFFKPTVADSSAFDLNIGDLDFTLDQKQDAFSADKVHVSKSEIIEVEKEDASGMLASLPGMDEPSSPVDVPADMSALNFDLSDISLDLNLMENQAESTYDKSSANMDAEVPTLDFAEEPNLEALNAAGGSVFAQESFESSLITDMEADLSPDSEMATKLDLAIAYQEIGDHDGARELLDEVIKGGNPEQSEKARSLLMSLA